MKKRIVIVALLLAWLWPAAGRCTTVTGKVSDPSGNAVSGATVSFRLVNLGNGNIARVSGTEIVATSGVAVETASDGTFSATVTGNDNITPSGTLYEVIIRGPGFTYGPLDYSITGSAADLNTLAPTNTRVNTATQVAASQMPALTGVISSPAGSTSTSFAEPGVATVFNVKAYGATGNGATDDTAAVNAAFAAAYAAGGGVIYFPVGTYLIAGALTIPNDGGTNPKQPPYVIEGAGMQVSGSWATPAVNGSVLVLTDTSNTVGKIDTRGSGYMEIKGLSLTDTASDSVPFIHTTNTTIHVHDCSFTSSQTGTANVQDAIILGGPNPTDIGTGLADAPFQGYGTVITHNFFAQVRHAVVGNTYANGVQITENTVGNRSGSSTAGDAPFKFVGYGSGSNADSGGYISGNLLELTNYYYGVRLDQYTEDFVMLGNSAFDAGTNTIGTYYLGTGSEAQIASCGQIAGVCLDATSPGATSNNYVAFTPTVDANGNGSYIGNNPMFPQGFTVRSGQPIKLQTLPGQETQIYEQSYNTYIQPNDGAAYDSIIDHKGQWGILNTSPQAAFDVNGDIRTRPVAFASAPACSSTIEGDMQSISDSSTAAWGATITGGGANHVLGYCDGTNWTVAAK